MTQGRLVLPASVVPWLNKLVGASNFTILRRSFHLAVVNGEETAAAKPNSTTKKNIPFPSHIFLLIEVQISIRLGDVKS